MAGKMDLIGHTLGRYQILEEIGHGGMATVYKAYDPKEDQEVAIKVLSPYVAQEPKFKARFEQEIRVLLNLHHPNIVPVLDYGEMDEYAFIVMPIMSAGTLSRRLRSGPLPLEAATSLLHQMADALDFAHTKGVVHRDIKPSNILIDENGRVMLTDFGFARVADNSLSITGSGLIGTPAYMSPEQCRGEQATPHSDQYALGVVLYQMTTGSLPYEADTPLGVVIMHATEPMPPPRQVNPDISIDVERVILKALEKEPQRRYLLLADFDRAFQLASSGKTGPELTEILDQPTEVFDGISARITRAKVFYHRFKQMKAASVIVLAVVFALVLLGFLGWFDNGQDNGSQIPVTGTETEIPGDLLATIEALSTANAPIEGTVMALGEVETIVAGTLEALMTTATVESEVATPSDPDIEGTITSTGTTTPTATSTPTLWPTVSPSKTPTRRPPLASPTPTTTPIPPDKCKEPGHPVFGCTPTPTP